MIRVGIHTLTIAMMREAKTLEDFRKVADLSKVIRKFGLLGVRHFELTIDINFLLSDEITKGFVIAQTEAALAAFGATCSVHLPFRGVDISYPSRDVAEGYARMLAAAVRFARPLTPMAYVVHPSGDFMKRLHGFTSTSPVVRQAWDTALFALETLACLGEIDQRELAIENLSHPLAMNDYILKRCSVSTCLDIGHIVADHSRDGLTVSQALSRYAGRLRAVHLHDVRHENDEVTDHLPLGTGEVDYESIAHALTACGYDGYVTLEVGTSLEDACASALLFQTALEQTVDGHDNQIKKNRYK
jgi:sugar phosphate isomerase/epimerase